MSNTLNTNPGSWGYWNAANLINIAMRNIGGAANVAANIPSAVYGSYQSNMAKAAVASGATQASAWQAAGVSQQSAASATPPNYLAWEAAGTQGISYGTGPGPAGSPGTGGTTDTTVVVDNSVQNYTPGGSNDLDYNVGMVGTSYLGNRFEKLTGQHSDVPNSITGNDLPNTFISDGQMKGMIVSYIPVNSAAMMNKIPGDTSNGGSTLQGRFGFQFHYNPKEIDISYTGQPDVSLGFEASGTDPAHPAGSAITQSSINFQIPINRREDFKYYDPATKKLRAGVGTAIYRGRPPTDDDQTRIYEYGTMYDIEYLLAVCLGYKMLTTHRGMTADIGYVSGQIVEVLLGNGLKYLAMVTSVTVAHTIFNQRMVPTHSNLNITMSIVPDFPGV